jgi:hypothetical protein
MGGKFILLAQLILVWRVKRMLLRYVAWNEEMHTFYYYIMQLIVQTSRKGMRPAAGQTNEGDGPAKNHWLCS